MKRNLLWRGLVILASILISFLLAYPLQKKINLGLDLQGGMNLVLQVHTEDALRAQTDADMERLVQQAKDDKAGVLPARRTGDSTFEVSGVSAEAKSALAQTAEKYLPQYNRSEQADRVVFALKADQETRTRNDAVNKAVQTIRNRVDAYGVAEPVIQEAGGYRILVQLPGVDDPERVRRLIKNTAFLEFRIVRWPEHGSAKSREEILAHYNGQVPADVEIMDGDMKDHQGHVLGKEYYAMERKRTVTGRDLSSANPGRDQLGSPNVEFTFKPAGARAFSDLTGSNIHHPLAIVLDGRVASVANIQSRISDRGEIHGSFSQQEVQDLSMVLRSGALPAGITYLEERTVGPSLGRDSIVEGLRAGVVGTSLVVIALLLIYNLSGINAVLALLLNVLILFGGMGAFHSTLTLPGIAGIILTIGIAVDANVLVFERIREELRAGRTVRSAIDLGFERAFTSIIDTHVTTLTSAAILYGTGTGPIKGFAVTLLIGLIASIFTAVFVSRWIFDFVLSRRRVQKLSI
jgi:preprotein translocase subunit SecD